MGCEWERRRTQTRGGRRLERSTVIDSDGPPSSVLSSGGADAVVEVALAERNPVEWDRVATVVARQKKRLRLSQATTVAVPGERRGRVGMGLERSKRVWRHRA